MNFWNYILSNYPQILSLLIEHLKLTAVSVGLAILIGVPLGIFISYAAKASKPVLSVANVIQAIPSMALLGFLIPLLGIGIIPAIVAVVLYSLLPIIKNTYTGIENINPQTLEAARGIGLTPFQVLTKVQIPLALPVIMAGVRIASVTAVGLMTMAAFIGAGGLGYLVFSGIRTVNNNQILAGAVPACLLALMVDFLIGLVEKLVTPVSLQKGDRSVKVKRRNAQKAVLAAASGLLAVVFLFTSVGTVSGNTRTISVGSKDFTEQEILGNMVADLIEDRTDIAVSRKLSLGGSQVCFSAIKTGDIDLYMDYSGTSYSDILKHPPISDMEQVYQTVKKEYKEQLHLEVLKQMSFNNTYTLAVTQEMAESHHLNKISDLAGIAGTLVSGTTFEFSNRKDGLSGLQKTYGFQMGKSLTLDAAPRYTALKNGEINVIDAFSTDGLLKKFDLKTLEDDKGFFPPYYAIPVVREEVLEECPEITGIMEELAPVLTNDVMIELNYKVDELQQTPADVARDFLKEKGLIS
ncbi:glycine betaine ABC transporter substrate-binding protein [Lacrimispora saccharolytica]|uniref:Substrate-binding region of ABC-type glycine betaine transport system n=1 Tax=Lacrimispora saccharolytica (strain ATCC 35040 / DSM 2544 / NRCC 2533 / WM1) TaxID=610130 RepID=D9R8J0_LACSW|nr:glycine betaine ABC transporter substrate-binding protein [Lacrimispora saccharolytica]ADL05719.1 Substrate-binding region of ABC-type glycine betaine transport system [[Clostridium] saccharolyticum WM1]QRV20136.1 ABC transporter permease subunit [Lacrimispora saccharolytica]